MSKRNKSIAEYSKAFMVMEATSSHGGFPAYMNSLMARMELEMLEAGYPEPYRWTFSGGDGITVPVKLNCTVT